MYIKIVQVDEKYVKEEHWKYLEECCGFNKGCVFNGNCLLIDIDFSEYEYPHLGYKIIDSNGTIEDKVYWLNMDDALKTFDSYEDYMSYIQITRK